MCPAKDLELSVPTLLGPTYVAVEQDTRKLKDRRTLAKV